MHCRNYQRNNTEKEDSINEQHRFWCSEKKNKTSGDEEEKTAITEPFFQALQ